MDSRIIELLNASVVPEGTISAEKYLEEMRAIHGFAPCLLNIIMSDNIDILIRQAGAIYLKRTVSKFWRKVITANGEPTIQEDDRNIIREILVDAIIRAPNAIRIHLAVCLNFIFKYDFPKKTSGILNKIRDYLQSSRKFEQMGALLSLYQLIKNFKDRKVESRSVMDNTMHMLLPVLFQRILYLLPDISEISMQLQILILKIFFAFIYRILPLNVLSLESFSGWTSVFRTVVERPVPVVTNEYRDETVTNVWWKSKKWAMRILTHIFEKYGSPGKVRKQYEQFAEVYLKTFAPGIIPVILSALEQSRNNIYLSPCVLLEMLDYIAEAVNHTTCWKILQEHTMFIIREIIYPLMCLNIKDRELWHEDPQEYIQLRFSDFEIQISPVNAAHWFLSSVTEIRNEILPSCLEFVTSILTSSQTNLENKEGALYMFGTLSSALFNNPTFRDQIESGLVKYVFPEFQNTNEILRARACWLLFSFSQTNFVNEGNLFQAMEFLQNSLLHDKELIIKLMSAHALKYMLNDQKKSKQFLQQNIKAIVWELLNLIKTIDNDYPKDLIDKIVEIFPTEILLFEVEIIRYLAGLFEDTIVKGDVEKTASGILDTMESVLSIVKERNIISEVEPIIIKIAEWILSRNMQDFYENAMDLVTLLSEDIISENMWKIFELIYLTLQKDGFEYFIDTMSCLYNFVVVDTEAFLSCENRISVMYNICKYTLLGHLNEETECYSAKLLEVIILQCKGRIDQCIPAFIELVIDRMSQEIKTSELRLLCMQVIIAAIYYNPQFSMQILAGLKMPNSNESMISDFLDKWFEDMKNFNGFHDRKLCILALCNLIQITSTERPELNKYVNEVIPSILFLFKGLKKAYVVRAEKNDDSDYDESSESEEEYEYFNLDKNENLESYSHKPEETFLLSDEDEDDNYSDFLESYITPIDEDKLIVNEYVSFKEVLQLLQKTNPRWYTALTHQLDSNHVKALQEIIASADLIIDASDSKRMESHGGYVFKSLMVPESFHFDKNA